MTPYIGITDFMYADEVRQMIEVLHKHNGTLNRKLGVGVMISRKTLNGEPTPWSKAFPTNETIASIFIDHPRTFNILHYVDYQDINLFENLTKAHALCGDHLHAIQLDMTWPNAHDVHAFKAWHTELEIILQTGVPALKRMGHDPERIARALAGYEDSITRVLIDQSMGRGIAIDATFVRTLAHEIRSHCPHMKLVFAGGLGPETLHLVEPLLREFPHASIDAQGQLRSSGNSMKPIDWNRAAQYIQKTCVLLHTI